MRSFASPDTGYSLPVTRWMRVRDSIVVVCPYVDAMTLVLLPELFMFLLSPIKQELRNPVTVCSVALVEPNGGNTPTV